MPEKNNVEEENYRQISFVIIDAKVLIGILKSQVQYGMKKSLKQTKTTQPSKIYPNKLLIHFTIIDRLGEKKNYLCQQIPSSFLFFSYKKHLSIHFISYV